MRLYDDPCSGNGYKVRLILALLGRDYDYVPLDIDKAETRTPKFLGKNPNGRIPLLELDDGRLLAEFNAILHYLAEGSAFLPTDRFAHAQVLQWMFFEQYSHEPNIATVRFWLTTWGRVDALVSRIGGAEKGRGIRGAGRDGKPSAICQVLRLRDSIRSPTSPSTPIPTWPTKAALTCRDIRRLGHGSTAWRPSRGMCRLSADPVMMDQSGSQISSVRSLGFGL